MPSPRLAVALLLLAAALAASGAAAAAVQVHARSMAAEWAWSAASDDSCWGSPEECPVVFDSGAGGGGVGGSGRGRRRLQYYYDAAADSLLPTADYISYSTLMQDSVPCSVPGASYYNCQPAGGAEVNPYTRSCSAITKCRD